MKTTKIKDEAESINERIKILIDKLCDTDVLDELTNEEIELRIFLINDIRSTLKFEKKHIKKYFLNK